MKILFVVSGIGYGDAVREHSNIIEIKKIFPRAKILVAGYDHSYDYFKDKYDIVRIRGYKLPGKNMKIQVGNFVAKNLLLPFFWFTGTLKVTLERFNFKPDLIISDFEPVGISLAKIIGKKCVVVFGYDPLLYREYKGKINYKMRTEARYFEYLYGNADRVIIPSLLKRKHKSEKYTYVNPIVSRLPEDLPSEQRIVNEFKLNKRPILVMLGGSDFGSKLAYNIAGLAKNYKEKFIIFGGNLDRKKLNGVKYIKYTKDFLKYLKVCRGVITLGGQLTLAEALVYKKPVLCFPIKDHVEQMLNAYAIRNIAMIGYNSDTFYVKNILTEFIANLKDLRERAEKYDLRNGGSREIAEEVKKML